MRAFALTAFIVIGCSSNSTSTTASSLTGSWCGKAVATAAECTGDEVGYVVLTQSGDTVTGKHCQAFESECYDIQSGKIASGRFTYFYTFGSDRVDADFAIGGTLSGTLRSTKAPGMNFPYVLTRVP